MQYTPYSIPFVEPPPVLIVDLSARKAGILLYDGRLIADTDEDKSMSIHKKHVKTTVDQIISGQLALPLTRDEVTYPTIVETNTITVPFVI